ncbi:hypothetical protein RHS01_04021 [Rhizoctonia solani]|uniref:Mannoprotein n=1 Tax=Rhizoctonia solani TaxID=456999 RepID=A0A8H7M6N5_9AGAM|nr:hypothetical protein RHS01_04021 [Rhizoctonia solani]
MRCWCSCPDSALQKRFEWNNLPYKVDTDTGERGTQYGYNLCNSTTENQHSLCQTAVVNSIDDFCLWGPPEPNSVVGNTEGEAVAYCTKPGRGTRLIPQGALTGVQFMKTPDYVQVVGFIEQQHINMQEDDYGGEMDPHGADQRGNPLGGLVFSNAFGTDKSQYTQVVEWHNFMGGKVFCMKACDPAGPNAAHYCEHIFDRIGCQYNAPAAYARGVFESAKVKAKTSQPPESLGAITTVHTLLVSPSLPTALLPPARLSTLVSLPVPLLFVYRNQCYWCILGCRNWHQQACCGFHYSFRLVYIFLHGRPSANSAASTRVFDFAGLAVAGAMTFAGALMGVALL